MYRRYRYVGPPEIASAAQNIAPGIAFRSTADVLSWVKRFSIDFDRSGRIIQTFVVAEDGYLRVADRHSEHVACAGGAPVLAAGEVTFRLVGAFVEAEAVTNQSTGYCPEPESWNAMAEALAGAGIRGPNRYTTAFVFRRCLHCDQINVIKEEIYECAICSRTLPLEWNCELRSA